VTFNLQLYEFQHEAVSFMLEHPRCINASQMGTGKTVEFLYMCSELEPRHVLIVCPKTLISEWCWQIDHILNEHCATPHPQTKLSNIDIHGPRFVCVNYDLLVRPVYLYTLRKVEWDIICFDECHHIKNHKAKRTRAG